MFYIQWMLQIPGATSYMGCIGKDKFGEEMKKNSKLAGVNVSVPCLLILLYSFLIRLSCPDLVIQWWSIAYLSFHVGSLLWGWVCPNRHMCCLCHGRWKVGFYMRILYSFFFTSVLLVDLIWWNAASVPICLIYQFLMQVKYQISIQRRRNFFLFNFYLDTHLFRGCWLWFNSNAATQQKLHWFLSLYRDSISVTLVQVYIPTSYSWVFWSQPILIEHLRVPAFFIYIYI